MTSEETITYLEWMKDLAEDLETPEQKNTMLKTINMSIKALKAIDEIEKLCDNPDYMTDDPENDSGSWAVIPVDDVMEIIEQIPEVEE